MEQNQMDRKNALMILGFDANSTPTEKEIRKAFKKTALEHHPDKGGSTDKFHSVKIAVEVLLDPSVVKNEMTKKSWNKYVSSELDLASLLKKYISPDLTPKRHMSVALTVSDYYNRSTINVPNYGNHVFEHLGENDVEEYILLPYLIADKIFSPENNLDVSQKVECTFSTLLFGGELQYISLSGKKIKTPPIKGSKKIIGRKITLREKGLTSDGRTGDMILNLIPNFENTDFDKVVKNEKLIREIFK